MSVTVTKVRHSWPEAAGFTINRPKGIDSYTFLYFHNGVELKLDGVVSVTEPGSWILFKPHTPQWFCSREPLKHDWMHLLGDVEEALSQVGLEADRLYTPKNGRFITDAVRKIEHEHFSKAEHHHLMEELKFRELLLKLARSCSSGAPGKKPKPAMAKQLQQVRSTVFSNLGDSWTVEKMAGLCYLSPSRFHTVYRNLFGISPTEDLIRARLESAKHRLTATQDTIQEIADSLGYKNVTHFCRQFKAFTEVTPSQYRASPE